MGYDRAQEGPGKYLNPKFEIGYLQRAERLASGAEILRMRRKNFKRWSKTERSDKFCPPHPSREARGRRAARIRSGNSANQEEEPVAVWSEAKLRDREK
jgi:hypothetical protein